MKLAYFVHDVTDAAADRRVRMLRMAGVEVIVAGFRRADAPVETLGGAPVIDLGRTYDARLGHRALEVARWALNAQVAQALQGAHAIMARNLEMLALAAAMRRPINRAAPLVYECLDIHRLMFAPSPQGQLMRMAERRLLAQCQLLIVSSPAFLSGYFEPVQHIEGLQLKTLLLENKCLSADPIGRKPMGGPRPAGPPWRVGWFGILRCRQTLEILAALTRRRPDLLQVAMRGRPSPAVFEDFAAEVAEVPGMAFGGAFAAEELPALYRRQHFVWAVDYYDDGKNSALLLPNRIYEAGAQHCVPIAQDGVEIGRWLQAQGLGVRMQDPQAELEGFLERLTPGRFRALEDAMAQTDRGVFCTDAAECAALKGLLGDLITRRARKLSQGADPAFDPAGARTPATS